MGYFALLVETLNLSVTGAGLLADDVQSVAQSAAGKDPTVEKDPLASGLPVGDDQQVVRKQKHIERALEVGRDRLAQNLRAGSPAIQNPAQDTPVLFYRHQIS